MPRFILLLLLVVFALASIVSGMLMGSANLPFAKVIESLLGNASGLDAQIVLQLRLPRVLSAFACGGLLAVAGALLQVLLRNPLADPYILGISGGAAVAALGGMLLGLSWGGVNLLALTGALAAIGLVFGLSYGDGFWDMRRLLLTGVVLSAGFGALISLMLVLAPTAQVQGMLFWLMGDLSHAQNPAVVWGTMVFVSGFSLWQAQSLNILSLGEIKAKTLGVSVVPLQIGIYFLAAVATSAAVMEAGAIGFVGLVIPHMVRLLGISDYRWLIPMALLLGGGFLTVADTLARTIVAPGQLPVGVLTALLGVPVLLMLLRKIR
ncbi:FecCD family ABC transporter permease [Sulfurirhabdus autotrophica]|uniref:Iron complex transport system permease protein n=1 Tax=Sulfurirhabdus autotrophica TaxID=1706046 RepID=A0A4R3Y5Z4_9PROT|nr:iron ABC transporter permease [Sulfurirhabdus autotrophica]TCV85884.1 iron complex transport system permease protein [Sulfurirhabdus autotrophica]